ncbi:MAG: M15 family metallopeptidase [Bacteroidales bacterium]|nr:M15 family metallopeptidase [Bacteroidales bacterium]
MKNIHLFSLLSLFALLVFCCGNINNPGEYTNHYSSDYDNTTGIKNDTVIDKNYLLGKFSPEQHPGFIKIDPSHTTKQNIYLRKEAYEAFVRMKNSAKKENISLTIVSGTRNFDSQKSIWEAKWNGQRKVEVYDLTTIQDPVERARMILRYSSMPGTSRHHWGTDIDINSVSPAYFESEQGKKTYTWLVAHAPDFGFCQTYTPKDSLRPTGYEEEQWHWSYIPIAGLLTTQYQKQITHDDINGFDGAETATDIDVIKNYVMGINKTCIQH